MLLNIWRLLKFQLGLHKQKIAVKTSELKSIFDSFESKKILIIGDVMIDSYMWGRVDRISPEAPIPVVSVTNIENRLGGAGNVALNIKAMGATPILCSVIGKDIHESVFFNLLASQNLFSQGIISSAERKTTIKTRVISDGHHLLRVDEEITKNLDPETESKLIQKIAEIILSEKIDAIIFEDYDKGVITSKVIETTVDLANSKNIPVSVDPKKRNFNNYKNVTLFKPNFKELVEGLKLDIRKTDIQKIHEAAVQFQKTNKITYAMVTLSEQGVCISNSENYFHIPAAVRDIADVSGAGDTVISVATLCLLSELSLKEIAHISNMAGGLVCEKVGVVTIDKKLLFDELTKAE